MGNFGTVCKEKNKLQMLNISMKNIMVGMGFKWLHPLSFYLFLLASRASYINL